MKENQSIEPKSEGGIIWTILKVLGLFSLVPLVFGIPFILSSAGEYVLNKQIYLVYLWILYFFIILSIFFHFKVFFFQVFFFFPNSNYYFKYRNHLLRGKVL